MDKIVGGSSGMPRVAKPSSHSGSETDAPALPEEIIYYDDEGTSAALTGEKRSGTMLTEETKEAILVIEAINGEQTAAPNQL